MKPKQTTQNVLVKKLIEIRKGLGKVEKTKRNIHFGYAYVGLEHLNALLEPRLSEKNILLTSSVVSSNRHYGDAKAGVFGAVETEHVFMDADSGEEITVRSSGDGWDAGDKATSKAITAAIKSCLKANFMISDEADDPEGAPERAGAGEKPAAGAKHKRTTPYEERTADDSAQSGHDLLEVKAFLTENKIPDAFLLTLLYEKKLIAPQIKTVASIPAGIMRRLLDPKSRQNLINAWKEQQADEETGGMTKPAPRSAKKEEPHERDSSYSSGHKKTRNTAEPEMDQRKERQPIERDMALEDVLAQDGYDNWRQVPVHFGNDAGKTLGKLGVKSRAYFLNTWRPSPHPKKGTYSDKDILLDAACCLALKELSNE